MAIPIRSAGGWTVRFVRRAGLRFEVQWASALTTQEWKLVDHPANRWSIGLVDEEAAVPLPFGPDGGFCRIMIQEF